MSTRWAYPVLTDWTGTPIVVDAHDGDTFRLLLDAGLDTGAFPRLRLAGVNAPELGQPGGDKVRQWVLSELINSRTITVTTRGRSFARWVADVNVDGRDLADAMVAAGHAVRDR